MPDPLFPVNLRYDWNGTFGANIENRDAGNVAACEYRLYNGGVGRAAYVYHGVNYTPSGPARADGAMLDCGGAGGVTLAPTHPDGRIWLDPYDGCAGYVGNGLWYAGKPLHIKPGSSVTPANNGDLTFEVTNNVTLTFKVKGSDGVVRGATLTLAP